MTDSKNASTATATDLTPEQAAVLAEEQKIKAAKALADAVPTTVYNRSPATYKHLDGKTGRYVIVTPGASGVVPFGVAENWRKCSNGLVTLSKDGGAQLVDANTLLAAERAKTAALDAKIKDMEARLSALDAKSRAA